VVPSNYPQALHLVRVLQTQIRDLKTALAYDTLPAWVIADLLVENERLRAENYRLRRRLELDNGSL
jgi:hypothetical protein